MLDGITPNAAVVGSRSVDLANVPWNCAWALLDEFTVAAILGQSVKTIRNHRLNNTGPRFLKLNGCSVKYKVGDLVAFIESQPSGGGGGASAGTPTRRRPGRPPKT